MAVRVVGRNQPSRIVFVRKSRTLQRRASSSLRRRCHLGILVGLVLLVVLVHLDHHVVRHELSNQSLGGHIWCLLRLLLLAVVAVTVRIGSRIGASRRIGGHGRRCTMWFDGTTTTASTAATARRHNGKPHGNGYK
jgi:hypothetical protein